MSTKNAESKVLEFLNEFFSRFRGLGYKYFHSVMIVSLALEIFTKESLEYNEKFQDLKEKVDKITDKGGRVNAR